ncbi:MAG: phosphodiesterase [Erysipelotrichaceae bacterium]
MKLLVASDLHGSLPYTNLILEAFEQEGCSHLLLLGDLMYHGPRNPLPTGYAPAEVASALNTYKSRIIAVRGNCDSEVDQMLLDFPMMADYTTISLGTRRVFATHGHLFSPEALPPLVAGDIFISGHIHLLVHEVQNHIHILNPGSIALPKNDLPHTYAVLSEDAFIIKDEHHNIVTQYIFANT